MGRTRQKPRRSSRRRPDAAGLDRAMELHRQGRLDEARSRYRKILKASPEHPDALNMLGVLAVQDGEAERGVALIHRALEAGGANPLVLNNLGMGLMALERHAEAVGVFRQAVATRNPPVEPLFNLGVALQELGREDEALEAFLEVLGVDPAHADAHFHVGRHRLASGDPAGAERSFRATLERKPRHVAALTNLGVARYRVRDLEGAEGAYRRALAIDPTFGAAMKNLGQVLRDRGDAAGSMEALWQAIQVDPDNTEAWIAFSNTLGSTVLPAELADRFQDVLLACLLRDDLEHQKLGVTAARILRATPGLDRLVEAAEAGSDVPGLDDGSAFPTLATPVVRLALERMILPDPGMEALWTRLRARLAAAACRDDASRHPAFADPRVVFSLARQCFLTGYIQPHDADEVAWVESLVESMAGRALGADPADAGRIAVLACYVPLLEWERAEEVVDLARQRADAGDPAAPAFQGLVEQQILEPAMELAIRDQIPRMQDSGNAVSDAVRSMYEDHPYPRWINADRRTPRPLGQVLAQALGDDTLARGAPESPAVLVAGCGTGKHLLELCYRYRDARLLGVDLSASSLAYALRKTREAGFDDVALLQADILALGDWPERFDVIESVGVLHHMEDPVAGWRVLRGLLKPGGLMKVGLYSERARADVVEVRERVAAGRIGTDDDDIRNARPGLIREFGDRDRAQLLAWRDFYSLQECRDLLFHVQEHRHTLPEIADVLRALDLEFLGFEFADPGVLARFREAEPEADPTSLEAWHRFEEAHPRTFRGMYQFWVRG